MEQLFSEGRSVNAYPLKLIYLPTNFDEEEVCFKTAVVAPKRNFKSAVKRNRIKRLLREGYRLNKHLIFNNTERQYALVILYLGKEMPTFDQIDSKIRVLFKKFLKNISDGQNS